MTKQIHVREINGINADIRTIATGKMYNNFLLGIEIELEDVLNRPMARYWNWKDDNSLRNHGAELVLPQPVGGADLDAALDELSALLNSNPEWTANDRCSVHCHLDFRDSTVQDCVGFVVTWMLLESGMYTLSGKDRYTNIYCPGTSQCPETIRLTNTLLNGGAGDVHSALERWPRYSGINLAALRRYGSIEIRTHRGTANADDIERWVAVLERIKLYSAGKDPKEIFELSQRVGCERFANEVLGDLDMYVVCDNYREFFPVNSLNAADALYWKEIKESATPNLSNLDIDGFCDLIIRELQS